jgi:hypothetical protein
VMVPAGVVPLTVTSKVTGTVAPAGTPAEMVHVMVEPVTDAEQVTPEGSVPQAADPATSVVPEGTVSVMVRPAVDVEDPVFWADNVYTSGVDDPATIDAGDADLVTVNEAALVTTVVVWLVVQPPAVVQPGPVQMAVLVMVEPEASVALAVTEKVSWSVWPAAMPAPMVQVMVVPLIDTEQVGVVAPDRVPQLAEPATRVVPVGTVSVTVMPPVAVDSPVFWTTRV